MTTPQDIATYLQTLPRNGNVAFRVAGDARDWFVAGYYGNVVNRQQAKASPNEFHPFGNSFLLALWGSDTAIDAYTRTPYKRVALAIAA